MLRSIIPFLVCLIFALAPKGVFAVFYDGTILDTYPYAWSENAGWIDFGTAEGNVHVKDSELTGYAWGELIGWISLNCSNTSSCGDVDYKVTNNGQGVLGGYAWSENAGWILFAPTGGGVSINDFGSFTGYAWGEQIGWIVFNCVEEDSCLTVNYKVSTNWRPYVRGAGGRISRGGGGGGSSGGEQTPTQPNLPTAFVPDYSGLSSGYIKPLVDSIQDDTPDSRRIAKVRQAILDYFTQQMEHSQELDELSARMQESKEKWDEPAPTDALRHMARADWKATLQRFEKISSVSRIAQQRGKLVAFVGDESVLYRDVDVESWYAPYVAYVIGEGIAEGYENIRNPEQRDFGVSDPVTYAELVKMALNSADKEVQNGSVRNQSARGTWASSYISTAELLGITTVSSELDVHTPISRGSVLQTIFEIMDIPVKRSGNRSSVFSDLPENHPYADALNIAYAYGFINGDTYSNGTPMGTVRPNDFINRAEVSKIIALFREAKE